MAVQEKDGWPAGEAVGRADRIADGNAPKSDTYVLYTGAVFAAVKAGIPDVGSMADVRYRIRWENGYCYGYRRGMEKP